MDLIELILQCQIDKNQSSWVESKKHAKFKDQI